MLSAADNELLTRTNAGTAMGEYFRRFWQPVALSCEVAKPDCPPIRAKVMGEDLIVFRDTQGRVGLIEPRCAHRGADLFFGRNEECGIRCIYHGWKYDVDGKCIELPNVPEGSAYRGKIAIKAYPTREFGELVWAYLGPRERMPEKLPELEFAMLPASHRYVTKRLQECNWAHSIEGALDTAHFSFLLGPGFVPVRNRSNDFLIDREEQKHKSFTGVRGVAEQDAMAQASQGVIADRTREHLTPTDLGVVRFRRIMLDAAKSIAAGKEPEAPHLYKSYRLRAGGAVTHAASLEEVMKERFGDALGRASA